MRRAAINASCGIETLPFSGIPAVPYLLAFLFA
jgi:hypothetical protein